MVYVDIGNVVLTDGVVPERSQLEQWAILAMLQGQMDMTIRLVDERESAYLNRTYRHKPGPTNVLSFPFEVPQGVPHSYLGDIVICVPIVEQEARLQDKALKAHWAHLVIHGVLHLQGYDHTEEETAYAMEKKEIILLSYLGFPNPYEEDRDTPLSYV